MKPIAQVKGNVCTDPNKPLYPPIDVGSDFWFTWLREPQANSFHFENEQGKFTARREERPTSGNDYWYAYKKIQGRLRKVYLGTPEELTSDRLNQIAAEINQAEAEYYSSRKSYTTRRHCVTPTEKAKKIPEFNGYPMKSEEYWVALESEVGALHIEAEQLRSQLAALRDELRLQETVTKQVSQERDKLGNLLDQAQKERSQLDQEVNLLRYFCAVAMRGNVSADPL